MASDHIAAQGIVKSFIAGEPNLQSASCGPYMGKGVVVNGPPTGHRASSSHDGDPFESCLTVKGKLREFMLDMRGVTDHTTVL